MESLFQLSAIPLLAALVAMAFPSMRLMRRLIPALIWMQFCMLLHYFTPVLTGATTCLRFTEDFSANRISMLFCALTTFVVACSLTHACTFFEKEQSLAGEQSIGHQRIFYASTAVFLLGMSSIFITDNLGFLWISVEATTLSSAALVYFARSRNALEATWKYLIICSVGIAFALLGTVLIFAASQHGALPHGSLNRQELLCVAPSLQYPLLRLGYIFCLIGYGTKAGIFPLHSWLPDAYAEAPAPAAAMLSGALTNCALFAIWRISEVVMAAHHGASAYLLPVALGTITTVAASFFLVRQHGIKRLWAYSSIENVGLMLVAIGFGSSALFFLQAFNHSIAKVSLFLLSGNIIQATGTKNLSEIRGILQGAPVWGILLAVSAFAVTGAPPFGSFISEWLILASSADCRQWGVLGALIFAMALSFVAVSVHVARILFGAPREGTAPFKPLATSLIPAALAALTLIAGLTSLPSYLVTLP